MIAYYIYMSTKIYDITISSKNTKIMSTFYNSIHAGRLLIILPLYIKSTYLEI